LADADCSCGRAIEQIPALVSHFISDALQVDRVSKLRLSLSEFRPIIRYHYNLIAIEAFKCPRAQVQSNSNKHRGAANWAKITINFVGREAKERVRRWHIGPLRSIQP